MTSSNGDKPGGATSLRVAAAGDVHCREANRDAMADSFAQLRGKADLVLPDFGEPSLRAVYAETGAEVEALDAGLREVASCPLRIVLLHYAPIEATLQGEPREIFVFLGSERLAAPIREQAPDLVLHGHAHEGSPQGWIGETPVHNVSQPVLGRDFWTAELDVSDAHSPIP